MGSEEGLIKKARLEQLWAEECEKAEMQQTNLKRRKATSKKKKSVVQKKQSVKRTRR